MFNMVAFGYSPESEDELRAAGFREAEVYAREGEINSYAMTLKVRKIYQFADTSFWENGKKGGKIVILFSYAEEKKEIIESLGFSKIKILGDYQSSGGTSDEARVENEKFFQQMKNPPARWYAGSWWGTSPD